MVTANQARAVDAPPRLPGDEAFWDAASAGRLLLKRCEACERFHYYPRASCPHCGSDRVRWTPATGSGRVYAYTVARRGPSTPLGIAYVTLDEGVTMLTNIVDCDLDAVAIGDRVEVVFKQASDGTSVPMFRPASATRR